MAAVAAALLATALLLAPRCLVVATSCPQSNFIVVLGGETNTRPAHAAELYRQGLAPKIIVTGQGDNQMNRLVLASNGVPFTAIVIEPDSTTTLENARFSTRLLRTHLATNAILVTSWFHSRRALACFRQAAPEIAFYSSPTVSGLPTLGWPQAREIKRVLLEYAKTAWSWVAYGLRPW